jgi:hypothetical protein
VNQTQKKLVTLAELVRDDEKQFAAIRDTARKLNVPAPKHKASAPNANSTGLQNYVRGIHAFELRFNSANRCKQVRSTGNRKGRLIVNRKNSNGPDATNNQPAKTNSTYAINFIQHCKFIASVDAGMCLLWAVLVLQGVLIMGVL